MVLRIERDRLRFKEIVKGKIKRNFKEFISQGEMIGRQDGKIVSIPVPQIDLPRFKHGKNQGGGVGQGEGEVGEGTDAGQPGDGHGHAGEAPGQHLLEVEVTLEELAQILGEELELPNIEPKGEKQIEDSRDRYTGIRTTGPDSLRHSKRTYKRALKRQIAAGTYDPRDPRIIPIKDDMRYRSRRESSAPRANALIIYLMDVSGSMGDEQKEIVRIESFWIDTWLRKQYKEIEIRYIVHDAAAREVDRHTFYHLRESGGTKISSAYQLLAKMLREEYAPDEWNIYPFHFSDGDNWGSGDTELCLKLMEEELIPISNQFSYGQVESPYGSGQFLKDLKSHFKDDERVVTSNIPDKDGIYGSIKDFLGKGN